MSLRSDVREEKIEWLIAPIVPRDKVPDPTHFRSTWLTASQASLRERGYGAQYEANLEPTFKSEILSAVPGLWLPMDLVRSHYRACDMLHLPTAELLEIGTAATKRANATTFAFILRMAQGAGVTPWTVLTQVPRIWERTCKDGGQVSLAKLGPKEARAVIEGYPLADMNYNRVTMRGIVAAIVELFCEKAYVKEIPSLGDARSIAMRISWA